MYCDIEAAQLREAVHKALDKLSLPHKTVVILYYYNGLTTKEIAKVMNCMQGTVKSRLHNARKAIEKGLKQENLSLNDNNREEFGANA